MKKQKTQRGITLVALIITIVVLLILAAVAIGAVEDSNIIAHSQNAASKYETEKGIENNTISDMETLLQKYSSESSVTYADFWKAAYEKIGKDNQAGISNHIVIAFADYGEVIYGELFYKDYLGEDKYFMSMINSDNGYEYKVKGNQWYKINDLSSYISLPEEITKSKSGTPNSGYEDLCELFDKAVGTEGCTPYVPN